MSEWINFFHTKTLTMPLFLVALLLGIPSTQADARTYKGDLTSQVLVFDVTTSLNGKTEQIETWFAQWVGDVYAKSIESPAMPAGSLGARRRICETASWIAPRRHIWREGEEPFLTKTQDLKYLRLDHSIKRVRCKRVTNETKRVSQGALKRAQAWFSSRGLTSDTIARDHRQIGNVETWLAENVPGFVSVKLRTSGRGLSQTASAQSEK